LSTKCASEKILKIG